MPGENQRQRGEGKGGMQGGPRVGRAEDGDPNYENEIVCHTTEA